MEIENNILNNLNLNNEQNKVINSKIEKAVNNAIDSGLRYILPDLIEEEIIELKNLLMKSGWKDGMKTAIENAINSGKSEAGIGNENFENILQIKNVLKQESIINAVSEVIDLAIKNTQNTGVIDKNIGSLIKSEKNSILSNVSTSIEKELSEQEKNIEKLEKNLESWKEYYSNKDFNGMQKEYNKVREKLREIIPIEQTIKNARIIETLHNLIKNKGIDFNLSKEEIELVQKLN